MYDLSPIVVTLNARPPSLLHYLVRISAVVGGVIAITREWDCNYCTYCFCTSWMSLHLCLADHLRQNVDTYTLQLSTGTRT